MRSYVFSRTGEARPVRDAPLGLALIEREPARPGPRQVQVAIKANALNFVDLVCFGGAFPMEGRVPLLDGAGEVVAVGEEVSRFRAGDRVVANPHASWIAGAPAPDTSGGVLGITRDGMLAEQVTLDEDVLVPLARSIGFA